MNKRSWILLTVTALIIASTAMLLTSLRLRQKLGKPGVKLAAKPVYDPKGKVIGTNCIDLPESVLDYTSVQLPVEFSVLDWLPKDTTYGQRLYKDSNGFHTAVNAVLMGTDRTSIHKPDYCLRGQGWQVVESQTRVTTIPIARPHSYELPITKLVTARQVSNPGGGTTAIRGIFLYWLVSDAKIEPYHNKIMGSILKHMVLTGELERWAYVTCFAICMPGEEEATFDRLKQFLGAAVPEFQITTGAPGNGTRSTMASAEHSN